MSSLFSGSGQMQSTPSVCRASPPILPPIYIPDNSPILVQIHWKLDPSPYEVIEANHRFLAEWNPGYAHWNGISGPPYPNSQIVVSLETPPGFAQVTLYVRAADWYAHTMQWTVDPPTNSLTWAPPRLFPYDHFYSGTLNGQLLFLRG